jgi:hypothetical protein
MAKSPGNGHGTATLSRLLGGNAPISRTAERPNSTYVAKD